MVGYEPDLNPFVDWDKEWKQFLRPCSTQKVEDEASLPSQITQPCHVRKSNRDDYDPVIIDDSSSSLFIKPCSTQKVEDEASLPSQLTQPYHLRKSSFDDYRGHLATPLVQVFSVSISTSFADGISCEVYGSIQAMEGPNCQFDIYNRGPEDSETINKHGTLSLIGPDDGVIIPFMSTSLELCLKDRNRGVDVVKGNLDLDLVTEDSYDRLLKGVVKGSHGVAYVYYVVFQFAFYGTVQVTVTKNDKTCHAIDIYGSVVARYEDDRRFSSNEQDMKLLETHLFEKQPQRPLRVMVGKPIRLSRNVVVVSAYSSFFIELNLWDSNGKIAGDCLRFPAFLYNETESYIRTEYACVEVYVRWEHAYFYLYHRLLENSKREESGNDREETHKKAKALYGQHPSTSFVPRNTPPVYIGRVGVEVFTVFVGGITEKISALCGAIIIDDGGDRFSIYNRDDSCSELLADNGLASIDVNYRAINNDEFSMMLYLRDPVGNLEVSKGYFSWNICTVQSYMKWPNKRVCSVVRGDHGYAAVHYEIFSDAYKALLEVKLFGDGHPDIPINLYGTLFGRYSKYDYTTIYDKKYYTSRLLDLPRERSVKLKTGSEIAMLKSIVVVPNKSSLIIEANLCALGIDNVEVPIRGIKKFRIDMSSMKSKRIGKKHYWIDVSVKFRHCLDSTHR